jgi:CDP-glycerol glycerophosphotransferase
MPRMIDRVIAVTIRLLPAAPSVAIHGFGDDEENALRIAHAAVATSRPGSRVYLLSRDPVASRDLYRIANRHNVALDDEPTFIKKNTIRGVWIFLRSAVVFYTHGLFGSPASGSHRVHVLLGHGHGPKSARPKGAHFDYLADLATTNSSTWGVQVIRDLGITAPGSAVITGNPREDAFDESADRDRLASLGLDPSRPIVVWLPTYRISDHATYGGWVDGERLDTMPAYRASMNLLVTLCREHRISLVTKSHVLDAQGVSESWGIPVITNAHLETAGLSFYQFLQLTDGLVSDFSSVWVDYLSSGKSIGLLIHDIEAYSESRGLNSPPIGDVASSIDLADDQIIRQFVASIARGETWQVSSLEAVRRSIGFPTVRARSLAVIGAVIDYADTHSVPVPLSLR